MSVFNGKPASGFTLIEVMIVVAILAILTAIGLPAYQDFVLKSNRTAGRGVLLDVASRQEQYFINNRQYTDSLTDLGYTSDPFYVNNQADRSSSSGGDAIFQIDLTLLTATTYTVKAEAISGSVQARDAKCTSFTLSGAGAKTNTGSGSVSDCW
ncbi:MAG: type IV pilin protein [Halieaceae bacterium]